MFSSGDTKGESEVDSVPVDIVTAVGDAQGGTSDDQADMYRMGKTQELKRNFKFVTIFGFTMIAMCTWEAMFCLAITGLINGGTAGLIWMFLVSWVGFILINTSMAELGSMAPTSGGQYHWVSEFAPRKYQKFLSYLMGWICVLGWQANCASSAYVAGTMIQGMITLNNPDTYVPQGWHGTLLTMAVAGFSVIFNTVAAKKLPLLEGVAVVIHLWAFIGIIVTLWVLAPSVEPKSVFTTFSDGGGWGNIGASTMVGISASALTFFGGDAPAHMSEELKDASRAIPRAMISTTVANGIMGWIATITLCFCIGDNLDQVINTPTGYPFMQVFYLITGSVRSTTVMSFFIMIMTIFSNLAVVATSSRQLFAFARDGAVPFGPWVARVSPRWNLPFNSILVTFLSTAALSLINIGSSTAFNSITSLSTNSFLTSYMVSIGCLIWRRWTGAPLLPSKFDLGKWGLPVYFAAEAFLILTFVLCFFPETPNPVASSMNWNIAIYSAVVVFSFIYYFFRARHRYVGPVEYVRKLD